MRYGIGSLIFLILLTLSNVYAAENYTSYLITSSINHLELGETLADVKSIVTENDVDALDIYYIETVKGTTDVKQNLKLSSSQLQAVYESDSEVDPNVVGPFIKVDSGDELFTYNLEFPDNLKSEIVNNKLTDLEGIDLFMLGKKFTIINGTINSIGGINITLMSGSVSESLNLGETMTYGVDGKNYEVTILNITNSKVRFMVNGEITGFLSFGNMTLLSNGTAIGIENISNLNSVSFYFNAHKILLSGLANTLKEDTNTIEDTDVTITSINTTTLASISKISFTVHASDTTYMHAGDKLSKFLEEPQAMISDMWDILYTGLTNSDVINVSLKPSGNDKYFLDFKNQEGINYHTLLLDRTSSGDVFIGKENGDAFVYKENVSIGKDDVFVVNKASADYDANTHVLTLSDINAADNEITIKETSIGSSTTYKLKYSTINGTISSGDVRLFSPTTTPLTVGGDDYNVWVDAAAGGGAPDFILIDLDGDGSVNSGKKVNIILKGSVKTVLSLKTTSGSTEGVSVGNLSFIIDPILEEDGDIAPSMPIWVNITTADSNAKELDANLNNINSAADENTEDEKGMNQYGITAIDRDSEDGADTIDIQIPEEQIFFQSYIISYIKNPHLFGPACVITSQTEICNELDDNCNDQIDENIPDIIKGSNVGICKPEIKSCINGNLIIIQNKTGPAAEVCDNFDNNCDGLIDNNCQLLDVCGNPVTYNPNVFGQCNSQGFMCGVGCPVSNGSCIRSTITWGYSGSILARYCVTPLFPMTEVCNNVDDDCDGLIDEYLVNLSSNRLGLCFNNTIYCNNGTWVENPNNYFPKTEICDDLDNNCNGIIDDGANCLAILSPTNNLISNSDKIGINITLAYPYNRLRYTDSSQNTPEKDLCEDCDEYGFLKKKALTLKQGKHNLTFKFISQYYNTTRLVPVFIDSVIPVLSSVLPKNSGYTNGSFILTYKEINLQHIELNLNTIKINKTDCPFNASSSIQVCLMKLNLSSYNNISINYTIKLRDIANNTKEAKVIKVLVDTVPPVFNTFNATQDKTLVKFNISMSEKVDLAYSESGSDWKVLCSNCDKYTASKTFTKTNLNLTIRAVDKAFNTVERLLI